MKIRTVQSALLGAVLLFASGCGGDGGGSPLGGASPGPVETSVFQVPRASAAAGAVGAATQAVTNVLLDPFTGGEASGGPVPFLVPDISFDFTVNYTITLDLDAQGPAGNDRFPDASGVIEAAISATGAGTLLSGAISHEVTITVLEDVTTLDGRCGLDTTIPADATWSCQIDVAWEITDGQNWMATATATKTVDVLDILVTDEDTALAIDVSGSREVVTTLTRVDGVTTRERTIEGSFLISVDDGTAVTDIELTIDNDGMITVTIGDEVFGPFTPAEFRDFFGCDSVP